MNTTLLFKGTRFRILLVCLFIMTSGNAYSLIVVSSFNSYFSGDCVYLCNYKGDTVNVIQYSSDETEFECYHFKNAYTGRYDISNSYIYINGVGTRYESGGGSNEYYRYRPHI